MFSFDTPFSPGGLFVNLQTFQVRAARIGAHAACAAPRPWGALLAHAACGNHRLLCGTMRQQRGGARAGAAAPPDRQGRSSASPTAPCPRSGLWVGLCRARPGAHGRHPVPARALDQGGQPGRARGGPCTALRGRSRGAAPHACGRGLALGDAHPSPGSAPTCQVTHAPITPANPPCRKQVPLEDEADADGAAPTKLAIGVQGGFNTGACLGADGRRAAGAPRRRGRSRACLVALHTRVHLPAWRRSPPPRRGPPHGGRQGARPRAAAGRRARAAAVPRAARARHPCRGRSHRAWQLTARRARARKQRVAAAARWGLRDPDGRRRAALPAAQ